MRIYKIRIESKNPGIADYYIDEYVYVGSRKDRVKRSAISMWKKDSENKHLELVGVEVHSENLESDGFWYYRSNI